MIYTDTFIEELIKCQKKIVDPPKDSGISRGSSKTTFTMRSIDNMYEFGVFISRNMYFQENFSIGLTYDPKEEKGKFCLLRCNGLHGETINTPHHSYFHIHNVLAEDINNGIKIERNINKTEEYSTFEDALQYFLKYINLSKPDCNKHFPKPSGQLDLDF
jgi:hypothetical protein